MGFNSRTCRHIYDIDVNVSISRSGQIELPTNILERSFSGKSKNIDKDKLRLPGGILRKAKNFNFYVHRTYSLH